MQKTSQPCSSSRQTRHDGSNRYLRYGSDLGIRAGLKLSQNDRLAEKRRELVDRVAYTLLNLQSFCSQIRLFAMID